MLEDHLPFLEDSAIATNQNEIQSSLIIHSSFPFGEQIFNSLKVIEGKCFLCVHDGYRCKDLCYLIQPAVWNYLFSYENEFIVRMKIH